MMNLIAPERRYEQTVRWSGGQASSCSVMQHLHLCIIAAAHYIIDWAHWVHRYGEVSSALLTYMSTEPRKSRFIYNIFAVDHFTFDYDDASALMSSLLSLSLLRHTHQLLTLQPGIVLLRVAAALAWELKDASWVRSITLLYGWANAICVCNINVLVLVRKHRLSGSCSRFRKFVWNEEPMARPAMHGSINGRAMVQYK